MSAGSGDRKSRTGDGGGGDGGARKQSGGGGRRGGRAAAGKGGGKGRAQDGGQRRGGAPRDRGAGNDRVDELAGPLASVLERLPATQRSVLEYRMGLKDGHPHDLADTARALGLSQSEARDIERRAFEHIREVVPLDRLQKLLKG